MLDFLRDTDYAIEIQIHPCGKMRWRNSYVSIAINIYKNITPNYVSNITRNSNYHMDGPYFSVVIWMKMSFLNSILCKNNLFMLVI